ncbi:hypothetical protein SLEP1_g43129 [Rubroshorea leprosula]|uniref:F-box domain-containing protein n=1 Tax=Rubroshorea leprosula TaxID=152421 RepID=A0AAV5LC10_9ROSI|nr:hypothetical protein SLEP1_g43129 [Rubroshorea leprosula]
MSSTSKKSGTRYAVATMGGFDRISSPSDEAAHYLLCFLHVGDLSQMMLVSKRWNRLC